jgi:hypothetical protein
VRRRGDTESQIGCGLLNVVFATLIWWAGYCLWYAPTHRDAKQSGEHEHRESAVRRAIAVAFPRAAPRLEPMKAGNLNVYMTRRSFEAVRFSGRRDAIAQVGRNWCSHVSLTFLPAVTLRDAQSGDRLGRYSCTSRRTALGDESILSQGTRW